MGNSAKSKWAHLVAIGGTGMGALAALLQEKGFVVTGSDGPLYPPMSTFLENKKIPIQSAYRAENLQGATWGFAATNPDLVVVGNAISRGNVEAQATEELLAKGLCKRMSFAEALAHYCIDDKKSFVVAGTHGKTTTTSLMAWAMEKLGLQAGFFIGGIPKNFTQGCRTGDGKFFASEGDEYDTAYWDKESKFLHYRASWVLCTGIEFDHADIFSSVDAIEKAFLKLVTKTRTGWLLIDDQSAPRRDSVHKVALAVKAAGLRLARYGKDPSSDYILLSNRAELLPWDPLTMGMRLEMRNPSGQICVLHSPLIGEHNALNLLGVFATLHASGEIKDWSKLQSLVQEFAGIKRRQEEVSRTNELVVIDDFAHHPTAISETINAIRARYPQFKLAAFFEPRSATSARNTLENEMMACFDRADAIFLTPPTKTNVPSAEKLDVEHLATGIRGRPANRDKSIHIHPKVTDLAAAFEKWRVAQSSKVVALVMSNGPFDGIHKILADQAGG